MKHILAIDQSTSATKAILYDIAGCVLDRASLSHQSIYPQSGWVEQDAEVLWRNTVEVVRTVASRNDGGRSIDCLSITNQRETFIVFDRVSGKPLCNAVVWQCRRGDEVCDQLRRGGASATIEQVTGLRLDSYFSAPKIAALLGANPAIATKVAYGSAVVGTIDAYLIHRLTHGEVFATDVTNASRTLLFNYHDMSWDPRLCSLFGVPMTALPKVRECGADFGRTNVDGALAVSVPIRGVMGDSQAALLAHACTTPGEAKVTIGTGSSVLMNVGRVAPKFGASAVGSLAWAFDGQPTYCQEGIINYSAATIVWLKDGLQLIENAADTESIATSVPDSAGVYLVPAFNGISTPHWSSKARAAIVGMSSDAGKAHVVRAALESIAYQINDVLSAMRDESGVAITSLHVDGGATSNRFLMQFLADVVGAEIIVPAAADFSPLGAALAGAIGMGVYESADALKAIPMASERFIPTMPKDRAASLVAGWRRAMRQVLAGVE